MLKYHVFLNSLRPQIPEHTHCSSGPAKYHVFLDLLLPQIWKHTHHSSGLAKYHVFLYSLWPQIWEHTHRNSGPMALYYTAVELEKNVTHRQRTDRQRTENREQRIEKPITEATLIADGSSG